MANNDTPKLSTCPICGYTDSSADADVLADDIAHHIRTMHNLEPSAAIAGSSVQEDKRGANPNVNEPPAAAPVAVAGNAPSSGMAAPNIGHQAHNTAPGDPSPVAGYPLDDDHPRR